MLEMSAVIEIQGLRKSFSGHLGIRRTLAVDGLELSVRPGEIFGLLGPNGAGKTTTLKLLLGLLRPDSGVIRLFGRPPQDVDARRRLGFLPENPYFYDYLTAAEFLDLYGRLHGLSAADRKRRIASAIQRVGLSGREGTALRKFSKGMTQRLGLAQAIQHDPELVILDEPMSGLDPVGRREVRDLILAQRAAGKTVFFSSHILQDAEMLCDRVAIVFRGKLRAVGKLDELVSRNAKWIEVSVRGTVPSGIQGECSPAPDGTTLIRVDDVPALTKLLAAVPAVGGEVLSVWPRRETLEDLFLREIGRAKAEERAS
jgi:ABC-2 type transport system ATP-binding protein